MNSSFIAFRYSNSEFIVPLEQYYLILKPEEMYLYPVERVDSKYEMVFENKRVKILDLSKIFSLRTTKATLDSRFVIGRAGEELYGFWVDKVKEILNLDNEIITKDNKNIGLPLLEALVLNNKVHTIFNFEKLSEEVKNTNMKDLASAN